MDLSAAQIPDQNFEQAIPPEGTPIRAVAPHVVPPQPVAVDPIQQVVKTPTNQGEALAKVKGLQALKLPQLTVARDHEKEAGTYDERTAALYKETANGKVNEALSGITTDANGTPYSADEMLTRAKDAWQNHDISAQFMSDVVKPLVFAQRQKEVAKGITLGDVATGVAGAPAGFYHMVAGAGGALGTSLGNISMGGAEAQKGGSEIAGGLESGVVSGLSGLQGIVHAVTPRVLAGPVEKGLSWASGGLVADTTAEEDALKKGDVDTWWKHFEGNRNQRYWTEHGEGILARAVGLSTSDLAKEGITISADERQQTNQLGTFTDPLMWGGAAFNPIEIAAHVGQGASLALKTAGVSPKVLGVIDTSIATAKETYGGYVKKIAGEPKPIETLGKTLETQAGEATRLAGEAADIAEKIKKSRLTQAAGKIESLGEKIKQVAVAKSAPSLLAAGAAYASGADGKEVFIAGLCGATLGKPLTFLGGAAVKATGQVLGRIAGPMSQLADRALEFNNTYRVGRGALAGALEHAPTGAVFALGAQNGEEAGNLLGLPMFFGAMGTAGKNLGAGISDAAVRRAFGATSAPAIGPVAPRAAIGDIPAVDALHRAAESTLSQDSLRRVATAQELANTFGADVYVAKDAADMQRMYDLVSTKPQATGSAQGVALPAHESKTGKPVAIVLAGSDALKHETWHAVTACIEAPPGGPNHLNKINGTAASALGAVWDPINHKLETTSHALEDLREDYQRKLGEKVSSEDALQEFIVEHFTAMSDGLPAAKLGGSEVLSRAISDAFLKVSDTFIERKPGLAPEGRVGTSKALPYSPSADVRTLIQNVLDAARYDQSPDIPSGSLEATHPNIDATPLVPVGGVPVNPLQPSGVLPHGKTFSGGPGILNPIPAGLATDQSLKTSTPPQQNRPEATAPAEGTVSAETTAPETAVEGTTTQGAIRGQEIQAARTSTESVLTPKDVAIVEKVQPDVAKQGILKRVLSHIRALAGQRVGLPVVEAAVNQDGVVRSKRLAPYALDDSSPNKPVVISVDLDRANHNAKLLFDWAEKEGTPERFGYTGINDPKFSTDLQTYVRNQAEGYRGSGEKLVAQDVPPSTGKPSGTLTRDQELFFNTIMGQTPPKNAIRADSKAAIERIQKTVKSTLGTELAPTETGSVEPNSLRASLPEEVRSRLGEDPDPTRRQANPKDRNSVITRTRLQDFEDFKPTGQSISQPNTRAIEASFMPANKAASTPEDFRAGTVKDILTKKDWAVFSAENPHNKEIPAAENAARNAKLESELNERGLTYEKVKGKYNRDENSFIIHGLDQQAALELAKKYDQESILTPQGLTYQDGSLEPALGVDTFAKDQAPDNFFTTLPDGSHASVQLGDKIHPESIEAQSLKASDAAETVAPKGVTPESPEFKEWFGDWTDPKAHTSRAKGPVSFAVDAEGKPLKLIHATRNDFNAFETGRETVNSSTFGDEATQRHAIFLAESPELSNQYVSDSAGRVQKGGRSIPLNASIKSPIDLTRSPDMYALGEELGISGRWLQNLQNHWGLFDGESGKEFVAAAKQAGYDGVIFSETGPDRLNDHTVYAVFDPEQVKSALSPTFDPKNPAQFMPSLAKSKVKGKDVQFKQEAKEGSVGGILEGVHFSSKNLAEIDPAKSFGKGAATSTDRMGEPKVFFYKKGTAYEAPISARSNVYEAKIDGNSIYDYNADPLDVRSIVNREKRDQAIKAAGFKGFYVETPGFDAIAIFDKIGVKESSHENVMGREQLQDAGKLPITAAEAASRQAAEAQGIEDTKNSELRLAKAKESVLASKGYELAKAKIAKEVGNDYSFEYNDKLDTWAEEQAAQKAVARVSKNKDAVVTVKGEEILKNPKLGRDGDVIGGARFMPTNEALKRFALTDEQKKQLEGRHGFAIASDWADAGRKYITQSGREIDVVHGGVAYPFQQENLGKAGWAGTFSGLSERVVKKINKTSGLGIVVMGGQEGSASSRAFAVALLSELEDSIAAKHLTKRQADSIVAKATKPHDPSVKTLEDLQTLIELPNTDPRGLTFETRQGIITDIGSHANKVKYGTMNWLDVMKKYNVQKGTFEPGQIVSVIQFKQGAGLKTAEQLGVKPHKSYEAVMEGAGIGMLKEPVFIKDFFADFFEKEGTQPKAYTRKVQTKMPEFVYGKGSATFPSSSDLSQAKVSRLSSK